MRINSVVATDSQSKEKRTFTFDISKSGKKIETAKGGKLNSYLEFCFLDNTSSPYDVEVDFNADDDRFSLKKYHAEDGVRTVLKKMTDGRFQVVARGERCIPYVENILKEQIADILKVDYINNKSVENFHGDLRKFDEIRMLFEVKENAKASADQAEERRQKAIETVRSFDKSTLATRKEQIDQINADLDDVAEKISTATVELGSLNAIYSAGEIRKNILKELSRAQEEYNTLASNDDEIQKAREMIRIRDDVASFIPKVKTLQTLAQQRAEYEQKRYGLTGELTWQENELQSVSAELDEKQRQFVLTQDKRTRIENINNELSNIATLYESNKKLNEQLLGLNEQLARLTAERVMYYNRLDSIEKSIGEVKSDLDAFSIPSKSVGELLETVRVDVKIDEVSAQIEKLQSEIAVKESQIAEKESNLVIQMKRFKSVAELDVSISPIKAKDTILQVLDAKYRKLEIINISLEEKRRNLERAVEDYRYRILQIEQSRSRLQIELDKVMTRKQDEFKREVFLNSQKVYSEDASAVFAVSANFNDEEVETLRQDIAKRDVDRDVLIERASEIDGALKEIKRHIEINSAEMDTLEGEKNNINNRYNEIVAQNKSEAVFNYLKALDSNNGTRYLLDVQQDAVKSESELNELKRSTEALRTKVSSLRSRLRYLKETQDQLGDTTFSVDSLVTTNDKLKEELSDIGGRLSANYEQYKAVSRQIESTESKLEDVRASIVEVSKTIKVNEAQIIASTDKAKALAGSDDIEQAVASFKYEVGDLESERQMLVESKQNVEREVFKKRVELEKIQWLYESKNKEYTELYEELQLEFNLKGISVDQVASADLTADVEDTRKLVAQFDAQKSSLVDKIENYYELLKTQPSETVTNYDILRKQNEIDELKKRQSALQQELKDTLASYTTASNVKVKIAAAAAEAETLSSLRESLNHNQIIGLLVRDKIKSMLSMAGSFLCATTGKKCALEENDGMLVVSINGDVMSYDELDDETKTAVYVSIILSVPSTDVTAGRWLIFEERIAIDKNVLANMLLQMDNVSYVVDYKQIQG